MTTERSLAASGASLGPDATQLTVAALWAEVLDTPVAPDADDNFFDLGGDSIAMVTLLYRVQEEFSVELAAGALFGAPSVRELSALIDSTRAGADDSPGNLSAGGD